MPWPQGVLLGILGGSVPPCSPNTDPISGQKNVIFHSKKFFKSILNLHIVLSFLHLELT